MMVELAKRAETEPVSLGEVAESTHLPKRYLDQLAIGLKTNALLRSVRGRGGGYLLTRPADEISVGQVTEAAIGPINVVECVLRPEVCPRSEACEFRWIYEQVNTQITQVLDGITVADLVERGQLAQEGLEALRCADMDRPVC
jgi:Rrf2 family protein